MSAGPELFDLVETPLEPGTLLIEASAGTGKTYCLTRLALRLLLEGRVESIERLLLVTFTNAATDELVTRLRALLEETLQVFQGAPSDDPFLLSMKSRHASNGSSILNRALDAFDNAQIFTIHGFCRRILERHTLESAIAFDYTFVDDATGLLEAVACDVWRKLCYQNELLASLTVAKQWTIERFLELYRKWRRFPNTVILPEPRALDTVLSQLRELKDAFNNAFDRDGLVLQLANWKWDPKSIYHESNNERLIEAIVRFVSDPGFTFLNDLVALKSEAFKGALLSQDHANKRPNFPVMGLADRIFLLCDALEYHLAQAFIDNMMVAFEARKEAEHILTYDDLLLRLHRTMQSTADEETLAKSMSEAFDAALIDEFQDTDPVQYDIFRWAFSRKYLIFVGDPKQAIYSFRGADVYAYLNAKKHAQASYSLGRNFRSAPDLVCAIEDIFIRSNHPFANEEIQYLPVTAAQTATRLSGDDRAAFNWWFLPCESGDKPKLLSKEYARSVILSHLVTELSHLLNGNVLLDDKRVRPSDIAILVRSNSQAQEVQTYLHEFGISSVITQAGNILDSNEFAEWKTILQSIASPRQGESLMAACATEVWGLNAAEIYRYRQDDLLWQSLVDEFVYLRLAWLENGFVPMACRIVSRRNLRVRFLKLPDGERRLTNTLHVIELIQKAEAEGHHGPEAILQWIDGLERNRSDKSELMELRLESDAHAIQISTIHKSKGLEYEIVFCPYLWEPGGAGRAELEPVHAPGGKVVLDFGSKEMEQSRAMARCEALGEELRLLYVALTRARERCYAVWGCIGTRRESSATQSALSYLLCQPEWTESVGIVQWIQKVLDFSHEEFGQWHYVLNRLIARSEGRMQLQVLTKAADPPVTARQTEHSSANVANFRMAANASLKPWQMISYSFLAQLAQREEDDAAEKFDPQIELETDTACEVESISIAPEGIFAFPKGAGTGLCLHAILERANLADPSSLENKIIVKDAIARFGLQGHISKPSLRTPLESIMDILNTLSELPLNNGAFKLREVAPACRFTEWSFYLPLESLEVGRLVAIFEEHLSEDDREYLPMLKRLRRDRLAGFITGNIDLLYCHMGRWYLIDWKSNHLGNRSRDYDRRRLRMAMYEGHYILQAYLYILAVHRYLKSRCSDYDYDRQIGSMSYVFLRGLQNEETRGSIELRPELAFIEAIEAFLCQPALL